MNVHFSFFHNQAKMNRRTGALRRKTHTHTHTRVNTYKYVYWQCQFSIIHSRISIGSTRTSASHNTINIVIVVVVVDVAVVQATTWFFHYGPISINRWNQSKPYEYSVYIDSIDFQLIVGLSHNIIVRARTRTFITHSCLFIYLLEFTLTCLPHLMHTDTSLQSTATAKHQ